MHQTLVVCVNCHCPVKRRQFTEIEKKVNAALRVLNGTQSTSNTTQKKRNLSTSSESSGDSDDSKIGLPQFECERKGLFTKMATDRCKLEGLVNVVDGTENFKNFKNLKNVKKATRFKY